MAINKYLKAQNAKQDNRTPPSYTKSFADLKKSCDQFYPYWNEDNEYIDIIIARRNKADGSKEVRPWTPVRGLLNDDPDGLWGCRGLPQDDPKPLFDRYRIKNEPDTTIVFTEGEKAMTAAQKFFGKNVIATTWVGGAMAYKKVDLSLVKDRNVVLLADCDPRGEKKNKFVGQMVMEYHATILHEQGCNVKIVRAVPDGDRIQDGDDIADWCERFKKKELKALLNEIVEDFDPNDVKFLGERNQQVATRIAAGETGHVVPNGIEGFEMVCDHFKWKFRWDTLKDYLLMSVAGGAWYQPKEVEQAKLRGEIAKTFQTSRTAINGWWINKENFRDWMLSLAEQTNEYLDYMQYIESPEVKLKMHKEEFNSKNLLKILFGCEGPIAEWMSQYFFRGPTQKWLWDQYRLDEMPIMYGARRIGKSTLCENIIPKHIKAHTSGMDFSMSDKEWMEAMQGHIIGEFAEMGGIEKADPEKSKDRVSRSSFGHIRKAFRRDPDMDEPKLWIPIGTTNRPRCIPDDPENRRFIVEHLPLTAKEGNKRNAHYANPGAKPHKKNVEYWMEMHRDYYFKQAIEEGIPANMPSDLIKIAEKQSRKHMITDDVRENFAKRFMRNNKKQGYFTLSELFNQFENEDGISRKKPSPYQLSIWGRIVRKLAGDTWEDGTKRVEGVQIKAWILKK